jgi:chaperone modulatory protein CbpM
MSDHYEIIKIHEGEVLGKKDLPLTQLSRLCHLLPEQVVEMVHEGIITPKGNRMHIWRFSYIQVERVRKVVRLQNDLRINLAGAALAIQLLERIEHLESELQHS